MGKWIVFLIVFCYANIAYTQNQYDYTWLFSSNTSVLPEKEGSFIDFRNNQRDTFYKPVFIKLSSNVGLCNNKNGELLFYSNGCVIADSSHQLMLNGDSINYGFVWDVQCPTGSYPGIQNSLVLPDPANDKGYYYFHKRHEIISDPKLFLDIDLMYSYIDMSQNNDKGKVTKKNIIIEPNMSNIVNGYLRACKHANGKDWWLIQMKAESNWYYKFLLNEEGVALIDSQQVGPIFTELTGNSGQAVFSPDGKIWMTYTGESVVLIHDFDRETGELSNLREVEIEDAPYIFSGAAISPNSRFAYVGTSWDLYQFDLWAEDIQGSLTHIAHYDGWGDPDAANFHLAQLGPDCRIYIGSTNQTQYLNVINKPNLKGQACDFQMHSFKLPFKNNAAAMPNFPHFRIDEEEVCDSTISSIFGNLVWYRRNLTVYPNPSGGIFNIDLPVRSKGKIVITDINASLLEKIEVGSSEEKVRIDLSHLQAGIFNVEYYPGDSSDRVFYSTQVVKQ